MSFIVVIVPYRSCWPVSGNHCSHVSSCVIIQSYYLNTNYQSFNLHSISYSIVLISVVNHVNISHIIDQW